ncbi:MULTISPECIES: DedA family protein [Filomicrobium]|uniref:Membrane protein DedA, SNARE-associated domain n=1 Tax=Filomicrobium insigne TaxID=418854 RepID=A0A1H0GLJ6_9HYPH|nr:MULTISPECIES: DedA family protein [Filomicrobium]MCV0370113.1 DedA family protein [Filomicrobium sp.]SDO07642.1 membrane protein DedA, SNARE-associated domain [Filomicrobium insigne]
MELASLMDSTIAFIEANRGWAGLVVFILAFGESLAFISLVLPFWAMLVGIGTLIGASGTTTDLIVIWVCASLGAAFGDWLSYWLGKHFHEPIGRMWPLSRYPDLLPRGHVFFEKYGIWAIFIGRFFGPLRAAVPLVAGITEMPMVPFQIANFLSAFLWAGVLLAPGSLGLAWLIHGGG